MRFPSNLQGAQLIRHSSIKQTDDRQLLQIQSFLKKYTWDIIATFEEPEVSATHKRWWERQELMKLLEGIIKGLYEFLLVPDFDRASRNIDDGYYIINLMKKHGVFLAIASTGEVIDLQKEDPIALFDRIAEPQLEIERLRDRILPKMEENLRIGRSNGGKTPFGFKVVTNYFVIDTIEELFVKEVFMLAFKGYGPTEISRMMPPKSYRGKDWSKVAVERMLTDPIYNGVITWGKRKSRKNSQHKPASEWMYSEATYLPKIIDDDLWNCVQEIHQKRTSGEWGPRHCNSEFLLSKLLRCNLCNNLMTPIHSQSSYVSKKTGEKSKHGRNVYVCKSCGIKVDKNEIESEAIKTIRQSLEFDDKGIQMVFNKSFDQALCAIRDQVTKVDEEIAKRQQGIDNHLNNVDLLPENLLVLANEQIAAIKKQIIDLKKNISSLKNLETAYCRLQHRFEQNANYLKSFLKTDNPTNYRELKVILDDLLIEIAYDGKSSSVILKDRVPILAKNFSVLRTS